MTKEEIKVLQNGGTVIPKPIKLPTLPNQFTPPGRNSYNEGVPLPPDPQKDFNQIPLKDMAALSATRNMDPLHRTDVLADEYKRGANLNELAKTLGKDKFKEVYKVLNESKNK